jgi:hypothetical protein
LTQHIVTILRIHFGPREKGETHEHILNRVVFYVNDQTAGKADDVRMAGAATTRRRTPRISRPTGSPSS